jgi:hypothetical protein
MKKLVAAIGLGAFIMFSAASGSLAAHRVDYTGSVASNRDSRVAWSETGTNPRLLFLNEALYPDTTVWDTDNGFCADGICLSR